MTAPGDKVFGGWKAGETLYAAEDSCTVTGNLRFTAQWKDPPRYTASFAVGEGSGTAPADQTVNAGSSITLPGQGEMTAPGDKVFGGWKAGETLYVAGASCIVTADLSFTAQWGDFDIAAIANYLAAVSGGLEPGSPVALKVSLDLASNDWAELLLAIQGADKYVDLDLSGCAIAGMSATAGEFAPYMPAATGEPRIVSLTLPDAATGIRAGTTSSLHTFGHFSALEAVSGAEILTIGAYAFGYRSNLVLVDFPKAAGIGDYAFANCAGLTSVDFPEAASIGGYAFANCAGLTSVEFPETTSIGNYAFDSCASLESVDFPKATSIGGFAFSGCTGLTSVNFPEATIIIYYAFSGCTGLTSVVFPKVKNINNRAFNGCANLVSVDFPDATNIGDNQTNGEVFYQCTSLVAASFPKATSLAGQLFEYTGVAHLTITLGAVAPGIIASSAFYQSPGKRVTINIPSGASGYGTSWIDAFIGSRSNISWDFTYY
jgi:hypothetical protein